MCCLTLTQDQKLRKYFLFRASYICVVWNSFNSKLKDKQYKQKTSPKSYKTEIKIFTIPGQIGYLQPWSGSWTRFYRETTLADIKVRIKPTKKYFKSGALTEDMLPP